MSAQHTPGQLVVARDANARRLVACWNACDGVPTEALEAAGTLVVTTKPEPT